MFRTQNSSPSFFRDAGSMFAIMSHRRRLQLLITAWLMILGAVFELVTIGAVVPLLALIIDPHYISNSRVGQLVLIFIGAESSINPIAPFAILLAIAAAISAALRSALTWISYKLVYGIQFDITALAFARLLRQPYETYVQRN